MISFFHFSGLNNGFCFMVVSAGEVERVNFAPVVISRFAAAVNPLQWKQFIVSGDASKIFAKSGRVIECASQRVVQNMLTKSSLVQIWMKERVQPAAVQPAQTAPQTAFAAVKNIFEKTFSWTDTPLTLFFEDQSLVLNTNRYLKESHAASWLGLKQLDLFSKGKGGGKGFVPWDFAPAAQFSIGKNWDPLQQTALMLAKIWTGVVRDPLLFSRSAKGSGEEAPAILLTTGAI